jgi:zinc transporter ZupT
MNLCRRGRKQARFAVALTAAMTAVAALGSASFVLASPLRRMAASTVAFSSDGTRFVAWQNRARPASSYKFEDLTITRQVEADGKPNAGFVSYFRLNRALPFAPRRKFEGEEEGGPRLFAAYLSVDGVHEEGTTETMGDDTSRHCYTEAIEVHAHEHQPRIGELVNVSLVIHGRAVINTRTRVRTRKMGRSVRKPNGVLLLQTDLPYEKAFGCLKMSSQ